jgi:hypothetical protein
MENLPNPGWYFLLRLSAAFCGEHTDEHIFACHA